MAHEGPVYDRPYHRPEWLDGVQADTFNSSTAERPASGQDLKAAVLELMASPNMCSKDWVTNQYDRYVQGNTALAMPDDAGVIRVDEETGLGVAVSTDANGRYTYLDPYQGAQLALAESYRNVATTGAVPMAVSDCLNFGSPEDPEVMWQFAEAVRGLADGCQELGIPVTGGNVSLYNQTGGVAIHPTPVVGVLGRFDDVARRTPSGWREDGQAIYLMGVTKDELDGSEWANLRGHLGGKPPALDLAAEKLLAELLINASRDGMIDAAHDLSEAASPLPCPIWPCASASAPASAWARSASAMAWTCLPHCSPKARHAPSLAWPGAKRCASRTCAAPAVSPTSASAWWTPRTRRWTSRTSSRCRWPS